MYNINDMKKTVESFIQLVRSIYKEDFIALHRPVFEGNEKAYLSDCIDSNYVSSAGSEISVLEKMIAEYTKSNHAVSTVNGTSALHISLLLSGVEQNTEVITQALTFVATGNSITYCNAIPVFLDVDRESMGLCPKALKNFCVNNTISKNGALWNKNSNRRISACVPMHTFGNPCKIDEIANVCEEFNIPLIEDAAESLGSFYKGTHTGKFGKLSAISFNGNKIITTGGGGMIITDDQELANKAKHITTTAKLPHEYEYIHNEIGYNYRMPNLNATLGIAQLEKLPEFLLRKKKVAMTYKEFFNDINDIEFFTASDDSVSNYWLNAIILKDDASKKYFLEETNKANIMTRPIWRLLPSLNMFNDCETDNLVNSKWLEERIVNIPSSVPDLS